MEITILRFYDFTILCPKAGSAHFQPMWRNMFIITLVEEIQLIVRYASSLRGSNSDRMNGQEMNTEIIPPFGQYSCYA